jgi:hypothetical protein
MGVEGDEGMWWHGVDEVVVVVELHVHQCEAGEGAGGPKATKPSMMARFQVRHVKWQWRVIEGDGGVVWMRWWQQRSLVFDNARAGGRRSQKSGTEP